ncbi:MAG: hypothetical protein ACJAS5_001074 [Lentimonas sp.]|jgi:hypothetical protein
MDLRIEYKTVMKVAAPIQDLRLNLKTMKIIKVRA